MVSCGTLVVSGGSLLCTLSLSAGQCGGGMCTLSLSPGHGNGGLTCTLSLSAGQWGGGGSFTWEVSCGTEELS